VSHEGRWFSIEDVTVLPKPVQQPLDVWLGGIAPSELRRVGRLADGWLPSFVTPDDVAAGIATIQEVAEQHERHIEDEHFGVLIAYANGPIDERVAAFIAARRPEVPVDRIVATSLDRLVEMIGEFVDVGASKFVAVPFAPMVDITDELEALAAAVRPLEN
jgi:alkanesulfonate monooxygenase SsuD/methylene tetrahydromethanopterin reductase-like flavin-dependent oxidoreductase (luciferase family)